MPLDRVYCSFHHSCSRAGYCFLQKCSQKGILFSNFCSQTGLQCIFLILCSQTGSGFLRLCAQTGVFELRKMLPDRVKITAPQRHTPLHIRTKCPPPRGGYLTRFWMGTCHRGLKTIPVPYTILYQFFQNVYPTLYQFFRNIFRTLYHFSENAYATLYQ